MKAKLIAIGILVLVLCAVVPMTASATAPTRLTVKEKVYTLNIVNPDNDWRVGTPTGKIAVNPTTGDYSVSLSKLKPGVTYLLGVSVAPPNKIGQIPGYSWTIPTTPQGTGITSTDGSFSATGTLDIGSFMSFNDGGSFIVTPLPSS